MAELGCDLTKFVSLPIFLRECIIRRKVCKYENNLPIENINIICELHSENSAIEKLLLDIDIFIQKRVLQAIIQ